MEDHIGSKLKLVATIYMAISGAGALFAMIYLFANELPGYAWLSIISGLFSIVLGLIISGFGELIDDTKLNQELMKQSLAVQNEILLKQKGDESSFEDVELPDL